MCQLRAALPGLIGIVILLAPSLASAFPAGHGCQMSQCTLGTQHRVAASSAPGWRFSRISSPDHKESVASITRTANTAASDADFAGLMVRCGHAGKTDVLLVLVSPLPPRSHPQVTVQGDAGPVARFEGTMATGGAAVVLPDSAGGLPGGPWQRLKTLTVSVRDGERDIKGLVDLEGLAPAYANLVGSCN